MPFVTPRTVFTPSAVCFFVIGFITLLSAIGSANVLGGVPWLSLAYAAMNVLLGFGFYMREKWLLYLLFVNLGGYTALYITLALSGGTLNLRYATVHILVAAAVWGVVYVVRDHLTETLWGKSQGAAFLMLWALTYVYTFLITLTR